MTTPTAMPASAAVHHDQPLSTIESAVIVAEAPPATPADRSISPSSSTKTSPIASTQMEAAWTTRFAMLYVVRNRSWALLKTMKSTTRPSRAGSEPMSPPRSRLR